MLHGLDCQPQANRFDVKGYAFRFGFMGVADVPVTLAYLIICLAALVLFVVAVTLMNRGVGIRD